MVVSLEIIATSQSTIPYKWSDNVTSYTENTTVIQIVFFITSRNFDAVPRNASFFGSSNKNILLDALSCTGFENDINTCRTQDWGKNGCSNFEEAGVVCRK